VRASDLLARLGGDEFVLLLWNCTEADALAKAWALEAAIAAMTARHGGATFSVGVSAGVTMLSPLDRVDEALDRADRAMYVRKAERNRRAAAE
jgi:diguanylate cyclase (GGDEF)-like protein